MFGHNIIILEHHGHWVMSSKVDLIEGMVDRQGSKGMLEVVLLCVWIKGSRRGKCLKIDEQVNKNSKDFISNDKEANEIVYVITNPLDLKSIEEVVWSRGGFRQDLTVLNGMIFLDSWN